MEKEASVLNRKNMKSGIHTAICRRSHRAQRQCYTCTAASFDAGNPFYAPSTLPFQAPPFDKIHDSDYQPAIEAGMAHQLEEMRAIALSPCADVSEHHCRDGEKRPPAGSRHGGF